jgi:hypothetical protein
MKVELADGDFYVFAMETEVAEAGQDSLGASVVFDGAGVDVAGM